MRRHQFYLNLCASLKAHQLNVANSDKQARLIALIAQAEVGNYRSDSFDLKQLYSEWLLIFGNDTTDPPLTPPPECDNGPKRRKHNSGSSLDTQTSDDTATPPTSPISASAPNLRISPIDRLSSSNAPLYLSVIVSHQQLQDYLPSKAENAFLEAISELDDIGIDYFAARIEAEHSEKCKIGVGTRGVVIKQKDNKQ